jgi:hypothetical protein
MTQGGETHQGEEPSQRFGEGSHTWSPFPLVRLSAIHRSGASGIHAGVSQTYVIRIASRLNQFGYI